MPDDGPSARQEFIAIRGVPQCCCAYCPHADDVQLAELLDHSPQRLAREFNFGGSQLTLAEYSLAQAYYLPVGRENLHSLLTAHFRRDHANGIAAYVDGRVTGHVSKASTSRNGFLTQP